MEFRVVIEILYSVNVGKIKRNVRSENSFILYLQLFADDIERLSAEIVRNFKTDGFKLFALCNKFLHSLAEIRTVSRNHDIGAPRHADKSAVEHLIILEREVGEMQNDFLLKDKSLATVSKLDNALAFVMTYGNYADSALFF